MSHPIQVPSSVDSIPPDRDPLGVLLVEDDPAVRLGCEQAFALAGIPVRGVASAEAALLRLGDFHPGIVVTDMRLPGMDGMQLIEQAMRLRCAPPVIMITGHGDVTLAVQAMRAGAYDFIEKPFAPDHLVEVARRALDKQALALEVARLRRRLMRREDIETRLLGRSAAIQQVRDLVSELADTDVSVLIHGETGTGKELVARALHELSRRSVGHYVVLNCGGLPENLVDSELFGHEAGAFTGAAKRRIGKLEYASGGTLFLDEIESMGLGVQVKLLRALQEGCIERLGSNEPVAIDCRVVAATKEDLARASEAGRFRADLYYRLNVVRIELPPLRERREDIALLFEHFVAEAAQRAGREAPPVDARQLQELIAHDWPGNVRELRNAAQAFALGVSRLARPRAERAATLAQRVDEYERELIRAELQRAGGSLARAAQALGVPKTTLFDKVRRLGLADAEPAAQRDGR